MRRAQSRRRVGELIDILGAGDKVVVVMRPASETGEPAAVSANLTTFRDDKAIEMVHYANPRTRSPPLGSQSKPSRASDRPGAPSLSRFGACRGHIGVVTCRVLGRCVLRSGGAPQAMASSRPVLARCLGGLPAEPVGVAELTGTAFHRDPVRPVAIW